MLIALSFSHL